MVDKLQNFNDEMEEALKIEGRKEKQTVINIQIKRMGEIFRLWLLKTRKMKESRGIADELKEMNEIPLKKVVLGMWYKYTKEKNVRKNKKNVKKRKR
jgi:hypothetical protein